MQVLQPSHGWDQSDNTVSSLPISSLRTNRKHSDWHNDCTKWKEKWRRVGNNPPPADPFPVWCSFRQASSQDRQPIQVHMKQEALLSNHLPALRHSQNSPAHRNKRSRLGIPAPISVGIYEINDWQARAPNWGMITSCRGKRIELRRAVTAPKAQNLDLISL